MGNLMDTNVSCKRDIAKKSLVMTYLASKEKIN